MAWAIWPPTPGSKWPNGSRKSSLNWVEKVSASKILASGFEFSRRLLVRLRLPEWAPLRSRSAFSVGPSSGSLGRNDAADALGAWLQAAARGSAAAAPMACTATIVAMAQTSRPLRRQRTDGPRWSQALVRRRSAPAVRRREVSGYTNRPQIIKRQLCCSLANVGQSAHRGTLADRLRAASIAVRAYCEIADCALPHQ